MCTRIASSFRDAGDPDDAEAVSKNNPSAVPVGETDEMIRELLKPTPTSTPSTPTVGGQWGSRLGDLEASLGSLMTRISSMEAEQIQLRTANMALTNSVRAEVDAKEQLAMQAAGLQKQIIESEIAAEKLRIQLATVQQEKDEQEERSRKLVATVQLMEARTLKSVAQLRAVGGERDDLAVAGQAAAEKVARLSSDLARMAAEVDSARADEAAARLMVEEAQRGKVEAELSSRALTQQLEQTQADNAQMVSALTELRQQREQLLQQTTEAGEQLLELGRQRSELAVKAATADEELLVLVKQVHEATLQTQEAAAQLVDAAARAGQAEQLVAELDKEVGRLRLRLGEAALRLEAVVEEGGALRRSNMELVLTVQSQAQQLDALQQERQSLSQQLEQVVTSATEQQADLQSRVDAAESATATSLSQLRVAQEELTGQQAVADAAAQELGRKNEAVESLQQDNASLAADVESGKRELWRAETEAGSLGRTVTYLEGLTEQLAAQVHLAQGLIKAADERAAQQVDAADCAQERERAAEQRAEEAVQQYREAVAEVDRLAQQVQDLQQQLQQQQTGTTDELAQQQQTIKELRAQLEYNDSWLYSRRKLESGLLSAQLYQQPEKLNAAAGFVNTVRYWVPAHLKWEFMRAWAYRESDMLVQAGYLGMSVEDEGEGVVVRTCWLSVPDWEKWSTSKLARTTGHGLPAGVYQYVPKKGEGFPEDFLPFKDLSDAVSAKY